MERGDVHPLSRGMVGLVGALIGSIFYAILDGVNSNILAAAVAGWFFERILQPDWRLAIKVIARVIREIPKAILKAPCTILADGETFEIEEGRVEDVIGITMVPDTLVVMVDDSGIHVHRVVIGRSGSRLCR